MASSITLAGESLKAQKQGAHEVLEIRNFVLALVPGLDPNNPIDRSAGLPPAEQIVGTWPYTQKGFVDPNRVVYSLMLGSDVGDFDWNWIGLTTAEGVLFATSTVPVQQKRRNIPPLQTGNNVTRNFMLAFDGAQALTAITVEASTWQHDFTEALAGKLGVNDTAQAAYKFPQQDLRNRADLYGPPSSLWGKGTIIGLSEAGLLGIPQLFSYELGVAELHGYWGNADASAGSAQRVFRTRDGRQFYQHQLDGQDAWSEWYETQNAGTAARSQNRTEVMAVSTGDTVPGLTIYTNIPTDFGYMPLLRITGALSSYTSPVEMLVGWYFYEGAVYMPEALVSAAGPMPSIAVGVHNGKIAVQIAFAGGFAYIPRLAIEAVNLAGQNTPDSIYMQGWTYSWALDPLSGTVPCNLRAVLNHQTVGQYAPALNGAGATGTWGISVDGSSQWATEAGYAASAGHAQVAASATWAGTADNANKLTLHGGAHCSFVWSDQGDSPMYLLGTPGSNPAEGRVFHPGNLNVATARRAGTLNWTAYGGQGVGDGSHVVFDASGGLSPSGTAIGSVDSQFAWQVGSPTLMGWNGGQTYGVRVDRARVADSATYAATAGALSNNIVINGVPVNVGSNVTITAEATNSFGVGQTRKNVTAQRAINTTYTNTSGKPIGVHIRSVFVVDTAAMNLTINGLAYHARNDPEGGGGYLVISEIVLPGETYRAEGVPVEAWFEVS